MLLKNFQIETIEKLLNFIKDNFGSSNHKYSYLSSPTGSGKTLILANLIKKTISSGIINNFFFIWISPHPDLLLQSKNKVQKVLGPTTTCKSFLELGSGNNIRIRDILFINWDMLNRKSARLREDREDGLYLKRIFHDVRNDDLKPILIVDESHKNLSTYISRQILEIIKPTLSIYVSATPNPDLFTSSNFPITISIEEVRDSGLIKKSVIIDDSFKNQKENVLKNIIYQAVQKRNHLEKLYKEEGIKIKPVAIIQLPNINSLNQVSIDDIIDLLSEQQIKIENKKLAVYVNNNKTHSNIDEISEDENVQFVIFKIALAQGWDCPRAQILVILRDVSSETLTIQTLGRIIRLPKPELGFRKNEILNNSYLITNLSDLTYESNILNYINKSQSLLKKKFFDFKLKIYKTNATSEKNLNLNFDTIFKQNCISDNLVSKLNFDDLVVSTRMLSSGVIKNIDNINENTNSDEVILNDDRDIRIECDSFILNLLSGRTKSLNSSSRIKTCIYNYLENENISFKDINKIIASKINKNYFESVIRKSIEKFIQDNRSVIYETGVWSFPPIDFFGIDYLEFAYEKNVYDKFYLSNNSSGSEKSFINFLNQSTQVEWWYKNRDHGDEYFYVIDNDNKRFFCDFIFSTKKSLLIIDTKSGDTINSSTDKLIGLNDYLAKIKDNKELVRNKPIVAGIVTNLNSRDYSGAWVINDKIELLDQSKINHWKLIDQLLK